MSDFITPPHTRWMIPLDLPDVLAIEHASSDHPWREEDFLRIRRQRNCIGKVAAIGERVVGFMVYEFHRTSLRILNLAVHAEFRRRGVGRLMAAKLIGTLSPCRRTRIDADVRETNVAGAMFLRACGFVATGVAREHYEDGRDAYLFEYRMDVTVDPR